MSATREADGSVRHEASLTRNNLIAFPFRQAGGPKIAAAPGGRAAFLRERCDLVRQVSGVASVAL